MGLSQDVGATLPYLRRFSRALTGSQVSGDSYVATLLETIIADSKPFENSSNLRISLFGAFCKLWSSVSLNGRGDMAQEGWEKTVQAKLSQMQGPSRQVFLLRNVEGFTGEEVAHILNKSAEESEALYQKASKEISEILSTSVMIIEDEPLIAMDIEDIVTSLGHTCCGIATTRTEAVAMAAELKPKLILSDVQLADGSSGIDAVGDILKTTEVPVIFITAFPERLLTGERSEPAFMITKPFSPDMVKAIIGQALFFDIKSPGAI
jgi:CheY-like chemotaxis protein